MKVYVITQYTCGGFDAWVLPFVYAEKHLAEKELKRLTDLADEGIEYDISELDYIDK